MSDDERRWASVSADGVYRYDLGRMWDEYLPQAAWVMLNPSTADHKVDDPTIRRVRAFTKSAGFGGFVVVNLFALRSPKPDYLLDHAAPTDGHNHRVLRDTLSSSEYPLIVAAWGGWVTGKALARPDIHAAAASKTVMCLGLTKHGEPRHPLYVPGGTPFQPYDRKDHNE